MNCAKCQQTMTCNVNSNSCWCQQLPAVVPVTQSSGCLCKTCLIDAINLELNTLYQTLSTDELVTKASQYQNQMPQNGIDFTINDQGYRVMSKWAHLKRGYCCGNGCLHCPY